MNEAVREHAATDPRFPEGGRHDDVPDPVRLRQQGCLPAALRR